MINIAPINDKLNSYSVVDRNKRRLLDSASNIIGKGTTRLLISILEILTQICEWKFVLPTEYYY